MDSQTFELISQGLRYWVAALTLIIFIRAARGVRRSFRAEKTLEKQEQGGFSLGVLEIVEAGRSPKLVGNRYVLRQENRIGRGSDCDIRIQERSVAKIQALIYQRGNKVFLSDYGSKLGVGLNGYRVKEDVALMDGDEIQLSHVALRLRLQGAYSAQQRTAFAQDAPRQTWLEDSSRHGGAYADGAAWDDDDYDGEYEEEYDYDEEDEYDPYDPA